MKDPNKYPKGWDRKRVEDLAEHYDDQKDDEAAAEDDRAFADSDETVVSVPKELLPEIREILAKHRRKCAGM